MEELAIKDYKAVLCLKEGDKPRFWWPRPVPLDAMDVIGSELDRLKKEGVLKKMAHRVWAAPIVAMPKKRWHILDLW